MNGKEKTLKTTFVLIGIVMCSAGSGVLIGNFLDRIGYLVFGVGVVFIGYSFSPHIFLEKIGSGGKQRRETTLIAISGWAIVLVGESIHYFS